MIRCRHEFHTPWIGPNITQTPHSHIKLHFAKYSAPLLFGGGSQLPAEATPNRLTDPRSVNHHNRDLPTTTQPKQKNNTTGKPSPHQPRPSSFHRRSFFRRGSAKRSRGSWKTVFKTWAEAPPPTRRRAAARRCWWIAVKTESSRLGGKMDPDGVVGSGAFKRAAAQEIV